MTAVLELNDITFSYPQREVLNGISFSIPAGSCTALVGPNGAGKTTLLRIAAGALSPTSGSVLLEGEPLARIPRRRRSCLIALVPQQIDVPFDFTVQQIVEQGRTPYLGLLRGPMREDRLAVERALDMADCTVLRHRIFNELSGGERQRVKIALGLAQQPRILLLDEPTQNLDIGRQAELIDLLHHLREQGLTIFASIHDLHLVHGNFSTVHLLDPGGSLTSGLPAAILTPANLARAFRCAPGRHPLLTEAPLLQESL
jgi:iron complex transport system ATP-binding protein